MKDSSRCQRDLIATLAALLPALVHQLISFFIPASRTSESIGPTTSCEIPLAGFLRAKVGLELAERLRERRSWHRLTLPIGACWGLLKQPDNQKLATHDSFSHVPPSACAWSLGGRMI